MVHPLFAVALLTLSSIVAAILGILNQSLLARAVGISLEADGYFRLLSYVSLLAGTASPVLAAVLIPRLLAHPEAPHSLRFSLRFNLAAGFTLAVMTGVVGVVWTYTVGRRVFLHDPHLMTVALLLWTHTAFALANSWWAAVLNSERRYVLLSVSGIMLSIAITTTLSAYGLSYGVRAAAAGYLVGAIAQACLFLAALVLSRDRSANVSTRTSPMTYYRLGIDVLRVAMCLAPFTVFPAIIAFWGGRVETGAIAALAYAQSFGGVVSVVVSLALSTTTLPSFSALVGQSDRAALRAHAESTLKTVMLLAVICGGAAIVSRDGLIALLLQRGRFGYAESVRVGLLLPWFILGGSIGAILSVLRGLFFALQLALQLAVISALIIVCFVLGAGALSVGHGSEGIGIAYFVTMFIFLAVCCWRLERISGVLSTTQMLRWLFRCSVPIGCAIIASSVARDGLVPSWPSISGSAFALAIFLVFSTCLLSVTIGLRETQALWRAVARSVR